MESTTPILFLKYAKRRHVLKGFPRTELFGNCETVLVSPKPPRRRMGVKMGVLMSIITEPGPSDPVVVEAARPRQHVFFSLGEWANLFIYFCLSVGAESGNKLRIRPWAAKAPAPPLIRPTAHHTLYVGGKYRNNPQNGSDRCRRNQRDGIGKTRRCVVRPRYISGHMGGHS